ncbi:hypothetical protein K438DRAFT_1930848 [Mycena galopus ATCC 62051]|nr:hypothetical protein K438DRAFT_1976816 [Mycena galopus ATCC 62051]KAF8207889.1 hypothetical protein K438DRAFT_1930848 [Mycena galopus ATCC 62051]
MDSSRFCSGVVDGSECRCHRFIPKPGRDGRCTCDHPEGYHPEAPYSSATPIPSAASIVSSYQVPSRLIPAASSSKPSSSKLAASKFTSKSQSKASSSKTSTAAALAETNAGMKRKRESEPDVPRKKKTVSETVKDTFLGQIIIMVTQADNSLRTLFTAPRSPQIALLETRHLAINNLHTPLLIKSNWDVYAMDQFFRERFPDFFTHMDKYHPIDTMVVPLRFHWTFLIRSHLTLSASPHASPDAKEMTRYFGSSCRPSDRKIFLASAYAIPASVWDHETGWCLDPAESEIDSYSSMEEDSESEKSWKNPDSDNDSPRRPSKKALGKARAKSPSPAPSIVSILDDDDGDFPAPTSAQPVRVVTTSVTTAAAAATRVPQPHPSIGTSANSTPTRPARSNRYADYSAYTTYMTPHFMTWDKSDFEIDPHFWTRPFPEEDRIASIDDLTEGL